MKKMILAAIVALSALGATTISAQNVGSSAKVLNAPKTERCENKGACCDDKAFEGINLTDAQKAQIKQIQADCEKQCKAAKEEKKAAAQAAKENKKQKAAENRRAYLAKIKNVLTPEQYTLFLENAFVNNGGRPDGPRPDKMRMESKKSKNSRPERAEHGKRPDHMKKAEKADTQKK